MPENETPYDSRPHFVIPYWNAADPADADDGNTRPVPANKAIWYLCNGIHATPYVPGEQLDVTIDIANYGGANTPSIAQVTVWWSDPTLGWAIGPNTLIGYRTVEVPGRGGRNTTTVMSKVIASESPHICLLARVSHQYDRAGTIADPVNDRHWAQRNLTTATAAAQTPVILPVFVGNPFAEEAEFFVVATHASERSFGLLADALGAQPVAVDARLVVSETEEAQGEDLLRVTLAPRERRRLFVGIELANRIEQGRFAPFEVQQRRADGETVIGGLGIALSPPA